MKKTLFCALISILLLVAVLFVGAKVADKIGANSHQEIIMQMAGYIIFLAGVFCLWKMEGRLHRPTMCYSKGDEKKIAGLVVAMVIWGNFATLVSAIIVSIFGGDSNGVNVTGGSSFIGFIVTVILAPICEEIAFRGNLYRALRKKLPFAVSLLTVSVLWAVLHMSIVASINAFIISLAITTLYEKSKRLTWPILAHMVNNAVSFCAVIPVVSSKYIAFIKWIDDMGMVLPFIGLEMFVAFGIFKKITTNKKDNEGEM